MSQKIAHQHDRIIESQYTKYSISNTLLEKEPSEVSNLYFKMLAVIIQAENAPSQQVGIFTRLVNGVEVKDSVDAYLKMAMHIGMEGFETLSNYVADNNLRYRFILDALIIGLLGEDNDEQLELIAEVSEVLKLNSEEVDYLTQRATEIVALKSDIQLNDIYPFVAEEPEESILDDYICLIAKCTENYKDDVYRVGNILIFKPKTKKTIPKKLIETVNTEDVSLVKLINGYVDVSQTNVELDAGIIILKSCEFVNGRRPLIISCGFIRIANCIFSGFRERTIYLDTANGIYITNSQFKDCIFQYRGDDDIKSWEPIAGVILANEKKTVMELHKCVFEDCGSHSNEYRMNVGCSAQFISNIPCYAEYCTFINCWHEGGGFGSGQYTVSGKSETNTMFNGYSEQHNCQIIDSAKFGDEDN